MMTSGHANEVNAFPESWGGLRLLGGTSCPLSHGYVHAWPVDRLLPISMSFGQVEQYGIISTLVLQYEVHGLRGFAHI